MNGQSQNAGNQGSTIGVPNTQGLGGIIASALGFAPGSVAQSAAGSSNPQATGAGGPPSGNPVSNAGLSNVGASEKPYIDVGGQHIAITQVSSNVILGGQTPVLGGSNPDMTINTPAPAFAPQEAAPVYNVGGQTITANPTAISLQGTALQPGDPPIEISGTPVSLQPSGGLVIGDHTVPAILPSESPAYAGDRASAPVYSVGDQIVTANPTAIAVAGSTILPGGPGVTIGGTLISLPQSGGLLIGESTVPVQFTSPYPVPEDSAPSAPVYTVGGKIFTASADAISIDGTTITPGGSAFTVAGTPVSLGPSGSLVIGSSTISLQPAITPFLEDPTSHFTVGGHVITANPTAIFPAGMTLVPGGAGITIAGTPVSLGTAGNLVVAGSTIPLQPSPAVYTVGDQIFTANPSAISLDGTTIVPGGAGVTTSGTPIKLQPSGSLVIGNTTVAVSSSSPSSIETSRTAGASSTQSAARVSSPTAVGSAEGRGERMGMGVYIGCVVGLLLRLVVI